MLDLAQANICKVVAECQSGKSQRLRPFMLVKPRRGQQSADEAQREIKKTLNG